jgi:hypothetical protein
MEQRPTEKVHYRVHKSPPLASILSHMNLLHIHISYFFKIHFNIPHLRLGLPSGLFPSGFQIKILYVFLIAFIRATCPAYLLNLTTLIFGYK